MADRTKFIGGGGARPSEKTLTSPNFLYGTPYQRMEEVTSAELRFFFLFFLELLFGILMVGPSLPG